jgi:hypothetical protein
MPVYPLLVMQQPIGAVGPWTAFVVWGLLVAGAIGVAFQSKLRRSYHRLAGAFDQDKRVRSPALPALLPVLPLVLYLAGRTVGYLIPSCSR